MIDKKLEDSLADDNAAADIIQTFQKAATNMRNALAGCGVTPKENRIIEKLGFMHRDPGTSKNILRIVSRMIANLSETGI